MSEVFVVRNQLGQYWGKKKRWVDGTRPAKVMVCKHEDEGVNLLVELGARDIELRGEVLKTTANQRGIPSVEPSAHRLPDEEEVAEELQAAAEAEPSAAANDPVNGEAAAPLTAENASTEDTGHA